MSTGAELQIIAVPVAGATMFVAGGAFMAVAGVAAVGGIAIVGTGRLCVAAGTYVADKVRERASLCSYEYEQYQMLRAQVENMEQQSAPQSQFGVVQPLPKQVLPSQPRPQFTREDLKRYHEDEATATAIIDQLEERLATSQQDVALRLHQFDQRAYLAAMIEIEAHRLPAAVVTAATAMLANPTADPEPIVAQLRGALGQISADELSRLQGNLRELEAEAACLIALLGDSPLRDEALALRHRIDEGSRSADATWLMRSATEFKRAVEGLRRRQRDALAAMRERELGELWGRLQAVGGLFADLQQLEQARAISLDPEMLTLFNEEDQRYQRLEAGGIDPATFREEADKLRIALQALEELGIGVLNRYQQQLLAAAIEQSLVAIMVDEQPFASVTRSVDADGTIRLRGQRESQVLEVWVRPNGRVKYEAYGFGDERCLKAAYALIDHLTDQGIMLRSADPELNLQATVVTQVIAAIEALGTYRRDEITIEEDAAAVIIEAGAGFQRSRLAIDNEGVVTMLDSSSLVAHPDQQIATQRAQQIATVATQEETVIAARDKVRRMQATLRRSRERI
ncbi:MAG: hypothetical protein HGA19_16790 [Oscillochloris sp.]|nr:hypothetical protein [Oscillochloris sp.]